jgi:hypothetical protein
MALTDSEVARCKAELGYSVLSNGASPWIDIVAIFEQVIQPYLDGEEETTIVQEILANIVTVKTKMVASYGEGALKACDELEWHPTGNSTTFGNLGLELSFWREQLAAALGIQSMWGRRREGAQRCAVY